MIAVKKNRYDIWLNVVMVLLLVAGLVILYSTSSYNGKVKFHDTFYYLKKQCFATALGIALMYGVARIDYRIWQKYAVYGYMIALALSVVVLFAGVEYNGSKRWLSLGLISFQPSEYAKFAVILMLANVVTREQKNLYKNRTLLKIILWILPLVGLVGAGNLSTAIIILGIAMSLIFIASPGFIRFVWMGVLGIAFLAVFLAMESYRLERLAIWRNPELYEKGYQTLQGLYAIGSGGIFGEGLGSSMQKLGFVPEPQNDMIFSIICEETGLVGACFLLFLFLLLVWRLFVIAGKTEDLFGMMIVAGVMTHLILQVLLNIAVVTNSIPNTGITLPFISYGGTSVLFLLMEMGVVMNVSSLVK